MGDAGQLSENEIHAECHTAHVVRMGNPADLATDNGPVIDEAARGGLEGHIAAMRQAGHRVQQISLPLTCARGCFVPPTLIEIDRLDQLGREVFGPVVHVLRFAARDMLAVVDAINATGYGLTFGMHSRIDESIEAVTGRVHACNRYVNRNMVGAVVGVQPFGGEGMSGTGPKAGGPLYLPRLQGVVNPDLAKLGLERLTSTLQLAAFADFSAWAELAGNRDLQGLCAEYSAVTPLGCFADLPGPTGETNRLDFSPRGEVFCLADSEAGLLHQIAAVLASGNTPILLSAADATPDLCSYDKVASTLLARLPIALAAAWRRVVFAEAWRVGAVLHEGPAEATCKLRRRLAAENGPLSSPSCTHSKRSLSVIPLA